MMDIMKIMEYLPHRYPILLVDRVLEITETEEGNQKIVGLKNVSINEPFFQGHFPGDPIMPGVLIVEGMAQCGGILVLQQREDRDEISPYFAAIDKVKFKRPVRPGDQLRYEIEILKMKGSICKMKGKTFVGNELATEAEMTAVVVKREN
jgi:beta-hydroxyacyl-ACP dehydratase FabZ